jgi:hypothetical protein
LKEFLEMINALSVVMIFISSRVKNPVSLEGSPSPLLIHTDLKETVSLDVG